MIIQPLDIARFFGSKNPSTLIVSNKGYGRHIGLDLAFHSAHAGTRIVVAGEESGDGLAFQSEWQRWRISHGHKAAADDRIAAFKNTQTISTPQGLEQRTEQAVLGADQRIILVIREFFGFGDTNGQARQWLEMCRALIDGGKPFRFLTMLAINDAPFDPATFSAASEVWRASHGFTMPGGQLRTIEGAEVTFERLIPSSHLLYAKGEGHPDIKFQYADSLADFVSPALV